MNTKLSELEHELTGLVRDFRRIGEILMTIRDERLYLNDYDTFEHYCATRWRFTHKRANQFIAAFLMDAEVGYCLENESQARNLHVLPDTKSRQEVVSEAQCVVRETGMTFGKALKACVASREAFHSSEAIPHSLKAVKGLKELQASFMALEDETANAFLIWAMGFMKSKRVSAPLLPLTTIDVSPSVTAVPGEMDAVSEEVTHE